MSEPQPWNKSTSWEIDYYDEIDEIAEARADLAQAILDGEEPKAWPITASQDGVLTEESLKWPSGAEAIFPKKEGHTTQDAVRIN